MDVQFAPDVERRLREFAAQSGREAREVLEDALAAYLDEVARTREMLESRYDEIVSGRVKPLDGEEFFDSLRRREDAFIKPDKAQ